MFRAARSRKSLTVRRAVIFAVLHGVLLPALLASVYFVQVLYEHRLSEQVHKTMQRNADIVGLGLQESLWALDTESATALLKAVMLEPTLISIKVLDAKLGSFVSLQMPERRLGRVHTVTEQILHRGLPIGIVELEFTEQPIAQQLQAQLMPLIGVLAVQVLASVLLILWVLQRRLGYPLQRLAAEAGRLAGGELETPITPLRQDEIGEVERQLEVTRQALRNLISTLEQKNLVLEDDLAERRRVEAILRDREQRLRSLVQQSPIAIIEYDLQWRILDWNEAAERIFGYPRDQVRGSHASILFEAHAQGPWRATGGLLDASLGGGGQYAHNLHADGRVITCQWYHNVIRDAQGQAQRIVSMAEDITEQERTVEEVGRLATVVRLTTNLVALTDAAGLIEWHNEALVRGTGYSASQLAGQPLLKILRGDLPEDRNSKLFEQALLGGEPLEEADLKCQNYNNQTYWVDAEIQPIRDDKGRHLQSVVLLNDITDKHRTALTLRNIARIGTSDESSDFHDQLLDSLCRGALAKSAYLAVHDAHGNSCELISTWCATEDWRITPGHRSSQRSLISLLQQHGRYIVNAEFPAHLDSSTILRECPDTLAMIAVAVRNRDNLIVGHLCLLFGTPLRDVEATTSLVEVAAARVGAEFARKQALTALQHSEQKFSSIFQNSPIPMLLLRYADGMCLDVNPAQIETFGYTREELLGHTVMEIGIYISEADRLAMLELLKQDGFVGAYPARVRTRAGGSRQCQVFVRKVMADFSCLLVANVDITDLHTAQRQVEELNQSLEARVVERTRALADANTELATTLDHLHRTQHELVRSEKLAALGSLVAGVAHELNTPIGNGMMVSSTLRDITRKLRQQVDSGLTRSSLDAYMREADAASDILLRNLQRAGELIASFKQVAVDQTSSQRRRFSLQEVVNEIVLTMQPVFRKTPFQVSSQIDAAIVMDSYPGPLGQVIANLLNNTILHAFEGRSQGLVELFTEPAEEGFVCLVCRDDGRGIPAANLSRVFDPFFTTKRGQLGTGLGLNIAHNIVSGVLGGDITVSSQPEAGTSFRLRLPLRAPQAASDTSDEA